MTSQVQREEQMLLRGRQRAEAIEESLGLAYSHHGRHFVAQATRELEVWLDDRRTWLQAERYSPHVSPHDIQFYDAVEPLDSATLAFCVVNTMMRLLMLDRTEVADVANLVGREVENEIVIRSARTKTPRLWDHVKHRWRKHKRSRRVRETRRAFVRNGASMSLYDVETRVLVGTFLAQAAQTHTGVFCYESRRASTFRSTHGGKWETRLALTPEADEWLARSKQAYLDYQPRWMSCVEPPLPWTNRWDGGFQSDALARSVMVHREMYAAKAYADRPLGRTLEAVNVLQDTAYAIDPFALKVLDFCIENDKSWGGIVQPQARDLPDVIGEKGSDLYVELRKSRGKAWRLNEDEKAQRFVQFYVRNQAREDIDQRLYFVHQIDTRGRMYPVGEFLNPQGSDYQRAMLRFADGQVIEDETAMNWLRIAGANAAGLDKKPYAERIQWVLDNEAMIEAVAEDPFTVHEWRTVDKPWAFLTFCHDYVEATKGNPSHYPVAQDGTCNGLQLWSLLLRDEYLGRLTNLVPGDAPEDVYGDVAAKMQARIEVRSGENSESVDWWLGVIRLLGGTLPRAFAKRSTMTKPYSVTKYAVADHLLDALDEAFPKDHPNRGFVRVRGVRKHVRFGADVLWEVMGESLRAAHEGMEWLQDASALICAAGEAPAWFTSSGLWVSGAVRKRYRKKVELVFGERTWQKHPWRTKDVLDKKRILQSVAPNYIHSLDAAVAALLILRMKDQGVTAFRSIHDSFAVHANSAEALSQEIRQVLVDVFQEDLLSQLRDYWTTQFKVDLPPLPQYGSLDIQQVKDAQYAFC